MEVILAGIDEEHLRSALTEPKLRDGQLTSFGTMLWQEPPQFPADSPMYIYAVTRGLNESIPAATYRGVFRGYRRREDFASPADLDETRPSTTLDRRNPDLPLEEQEPEWAGYLMVTDLEKLETHVPLSRFRVGGRPFRGVVVRHPMLAEYDG